MICNYADAMGEMNRLTATLAAANAEIRALRSDVLAADHDPPCQICAVRQARIGELEADNRRLSALLPYHEGRPVSQGAPNALLSQRTTAWAKIDELKAEVARLIAALATEQHAHVETRRALEACRGCGGCTEEDSEACAATRHAACLRDGATGKDGLQVEEGNIPDQTRE